MAKNPVIRLDGAAELNAALRAIGDRATGIILRDAAEKGAQVIADEARELAPRDTSELAESIGVQAGRIQQGRAVFNVGPGKQQWYGMFAEFGTEHVPAQPFLRPAFDAKAEEAKQAVADALHDALRDVLS